MATQNLKDIFDAKIDRYRLQGMPLEQAGAMAKKEMMSDPRIRQLMQKNNPQNMQAQPNTQANPADINIQKQGGGDWKSAFVKSVLYSNTGDGQTMEETDSGGAMIMPEKPAMGSSGGDDMMSFGEEQARSAAADNTLSEFAYSSDVNPKIMTQSYYDKATAEAEADPYDPRYAGDAYVAAAPYMGVNMLRILKSAMTKDKLDKEEAETLEQIKQSIKFKRDLDALKAKTGGGSGSAKGKDHFGAYMDDVKEANKTLPNAIGMSEAYTDKDILASTASGNAFESMEENDLVDAEAILGHWAQQIFQLSSTWDNRLTPETYSAMIEMNRTNLLMSYETLYKKKNPNLSDAQAFDQAKKTVTQFESIGKAKMESQMNKLKTIKGYQYDDGSWDFGKMLKSEKFEVYSIALAELRRLAVTDKDKVIEYINSLTTLTPNDKTTIINSL